MSDCAAACNHQGSEEHEARRVVELADRGGGYTEAGHRAGDQQVPASPDGGFDADSDDGRAGCRRGRSR